MRKQRQTARRAAVLLAGMLAVSSVFPPGSMMTCKALAAERGEESLVEKEQYEPDMNLATPSTPSSSVKIEEPTLMLEGAESDDPVILKFTRVDVEKNAEQEGLYDIRLGLEIQVPVSYAGKKIYGKFDIKHNGESVLTEDWISSAFTDDGSFETAGTESITQSKTKRYSAVLPEEGLYTVSAVLSENRKFDTIIESAKIQEISFIRPVERWDMPVQTIDGKDYMLSNAYTDATILLFGGSTCGYCRGTLKNLNSLLDSAYNQGDVRTIFLDIRSDVALEEAEKLAAALPNIDVCKDRAYSKYLSQLTQKAGYEERGESFPYVFILDKHGEITYANVTGGAVLERSVFEAELKNMGISTLEERIEDIKEYYESHKFHMSQSITYDQKPEYQADTYVAGKLSSASTEDGLNALNFVRYVAELSEVSIKEEYQDWAQKGAVIMKANDEMTHYPSKPADMQQDFFDEGSTNGTQKSNIGRGHRNLSHVIIYGWMNDGDEKNIERVGHRRWCLNPSMTQTGFGYAGIYSAMYVRDTEGISEEAYVPWPAQVMPSDYFTGPWSVSLNGDIFEEPDVSEVTVTMITEGKRYTFSEADQSQGYFRISNESMGMGPAIIIKPDSIGTSAPVDVMVSGLIDKNGYPAEIRYTVNFFTLEEKDESGNGSEGGNGSSGSGSSSGGSGSSSGGSSSGGSGSSSGGSSSGSGSSSGGSSGGGGGGGSKGSKTVSTGGPLSDTLPEYVVKGTWIEGSNGIWIFKDGDGVIYRNRWAAVYNPYANVNAGAQAFDWFRFDENGQMVTGWYQDPADGKTYYLNPLSDGTRGRMMTGWVTIDGNEYYFNPVSDGFRGRLFRNEATPDGHFVDENGMKKY